MAISDSEWLAWLANEDKKPVILVEADYSYWDDGAQAGTIYASDRGYIDPTKASAPNYLPIIRGDVIVDDQLDSAIPGAIDFFVESNAWSDYQFLGHDLEIYFGDQDWPREDFRRIAYSRTDNVLRPAPNLYRLSFDDVGRDYFDQLIKGNGRGSNIGLPFVFGRVFNVRPVRETSTKYVFFTPATLMISSGIGVEIRNNGLAVTGTMINHADGSGDGLKIEVTLDVAATTGEDITCDPVPLDADSANLSSILAQINSYAEITLPIASSVSYFDGIQLGYVFYEYQSARSMLDQMFASVDANPRVNADGELEAVQINEPDAPSRVTCPNNLLSDLSMDSLELPYRQLDFGYQKNWAVQDSSRMAGAVSADRVAQYTQEYYLFTRSTSVQLLYPRIKPVKVDSLIFDGVDANIERTRRATLRSRARSRWSVRGDETFFADSIGDTITIRDKHFFPEGEDFVVIGLRKNLSKRICEVSLWK